MGTRVTRYREAEMVYPCRMIIGSMRKRKSFQPFKFVLGSGRDTLPRAGALVIPAVVFIYFKKTQPKFECARHGSYICTRCTHSHTRKLVVSPQTRDPILPQVIKGSVRVPGYPGNWVRGSRGTSANDVYCTWVSARVPE
eukprot:535453-Rhodomonas_salina.3